MSKYNVYLVTTEQGVSRKLTGETAARIRKDIFAR